MNAYHKSIVFLGKLAYDSLNQALAMQHEYLSSESQNPQS